MALFDWLHKKWKPQKMDGENHVPRARMHHYFFAHKALPAQLWNGDSVLGILVNPQNQEYLVALWNQIGQQMQGRDRLLSSRT